MLKNQSGNVLIIILIAVVLFGMLSYAVTNSERSGGATIEDEQVKLDQGVIDTYTASIQSGQMFLRINRNCDTINYDPPSAWSGTNFRCHMFHPDGAGIGYMDLGLDNCIDSGVASTLSLGQSCDGIVYAGVSGGNRIYTMRADQGTATWNNGTANFTITGATSTSDGLANANTISSLSDASAPYQAAVLCRAMGSKWYLPSKDELDLLHQNRNIGDLNSSFDMSGSWYWSSSEVGINDAWIHRFSGDNQAGTNKNTTHTIRCVRRD